MYKHNIKYIAILVKVERSGKATNDSTESSTWKDVWLVWGVKYNCPYP